MNKRKDMIYGRMYEMACHLNDLGYEWSHLIVQGSQNYNLDVYSDDYSSDIDAKAIIMPSLDDIVLGNPKVSTTLILDNDEHIDIKDIRLMVEQWEKQNITYLELLHSEFVMVNGKYNWLTLPDKENCIISKTLVAKTIRGMSSEKIKALRHPYPAKLAVIDKYGYDPKQAHHVGRMLALLREFKESGKLVYDIEKYDNDGLHKKALLDVKQGSIANQHVDDLCNGWYDEITAIYNQYVIEDIEPNEKVIAMYRDWVTAAIRQHLKRALILG